MYLCGFVSLCARMSVAGANKVESIMNGCLLEPMTEILASKRDIA